MIVDLISVVLVALLVFLGWRSGAVRQILRVVAIIAVIAGAPFVAPMVRELVLGHGGRASPAIEVLSIIITGLAIYLVIAVGGWFLIKTMRFVSRTLSLFDRVGGATIGALKALGVVYLFAVLVVFLEGPITERDPDNHLGLRAGTVTQWVADHNVLAPWQFPDLDDLHRALAAGQTLDAPTGDDAVDRFLGDDRVADVLDDEEIMKWVQSDHYPLTLADQRIREILNDEELMKVLRSADWSAS